MREQILKLRAEGKTYDQIKEVLHCSKSTVSYHCGEGQKDKLKERTQNLRRVNVIHKKVGVFKNRKVSSKVRDFQRREGSKYTVVNYTFSVEDVINKFKDNFVCYLSGKILDITNPQDYQFDHIVPCTKGGLNTLDNLGILDSKVNKMKDDLTVDEFILKCKQILEFQGYKVIK